MAKKAPQSDLLTTTLLVFAVAGLGVSSVAASAGVAKLAYDFQMSLPQVPTTSNVAAAASAGGSGLTDAQVSAVLTLLSAFGAPQDTVTSVGAILRGDDSDESDTSSAVTTATSDTAAAPAAADRPPLPSVCPKIARHLMRGSVGDDVWALQQFLSEQRVLTSDNITGVFGSTTQSALARWQLANGIVATTDLDSGAGEVGTLTRSAIARLCGSSDLPTHVPPTPGWVDSTNLPTHVPPTPGWVGSTTAPSGGSGTSGTGSSDSFFGW